MEEKEELSLRETFIQYVGERKNPEDGIVTTEMCVEVLSDEFPEFLMLIAEENFMRGYHQALQDLQTHQKAMTENELRKADELL